MRLPRFDPEDVNVGSGGGGGGLPGGRVGCGTLVIVIIAALVFGVDPAQLLGTLDSTQQDPAAQQGQQVPGGSGNAEQLCSQNQYALESCNALSSLNKTWQPLFQQANMRFTQPRLVFYSGATRSGCGSASSAMGPFYCPADQTIYLDTSFYDELDRKLGAGGDFARYYVVAHEYGHHVQKLTGIADQVRSAQQHDPAQANALQVRMELQADCYAGVWAGKNRDLIEPGDMEEGLKAASAIGDDTLMKNAGQQVNPENFTHGTSAQRVQWLRKGLETGNDEACDTFADLQRS